MPAFLGCKKMNFSLRKDNLALCGAPTHRRTPRTLYWGVNGVPITVALLCLSYLTLSRALFRVPIGVAYAIWEGVGLSAIVCISVMFLGESLTPTRAIGLVCVFLGSVFIHRGTEA